jgi:hypothetical protein
LLVLLRNLLSSREPLYGAGDRAARHEPRLLGLSDTQLGALNDDRIGRALDRLFDANIASLALQVAAHAIHEFDVSLDQLHNDSTTILSLVSDSSITIEVFLGLRETLSDICRRLLRTFLRIA